MSSPQTLTLILERDNGKIWGRVSVYDNLLVDSATTIPALERKLRKLIQELEGLDDVLFTHAYDLTIFFEQFSFLNQSKIATISGLNPSLVRQYASGHKQPSREQVQKIEQAIKTIGKSLQKIRLAAKQMVKAK